MICSLILLVRQFQGLDMEDKEYDFYTYMCNIRYEVNGVDLDKQL